MSRACCLSLKSCTEDLFTSIYRFITGDSRRADAKYKIQMVSRNL